MTKKYCANKDSKNAYELSRRGFLTWLTGSFGTGVFASYLANQIPSPPAVTRHLGFGSTTKPPLDLEVGKAMATLFCSGADVRFHGGASHYLVEGIHSDNEFTELDIVRTLDSAAGVETDTTQRSRYELSQATDWVLVGAPSSNAYARRFLGYDQNDLFVTPSPPTGARFVYAFEDGLVDLRRFRAGGELQDQCIRSFIKDLKTGNIYQPDEGGWQSEDFLLVSRFPAIVGGERRFRTIIGGTHGIGTRGIRELLLAEGQERGLLKQVLSAPNGVFQILARVEALHEKGGTRPGVVRIIDAHFA